MSCYCVCDIVKAFERKLKYSDDWKKKCVLSFFKEEKKKLMNLYFHKKVKILDNWKRNVFCSFLKKKKLLNFYFHVNNRKGYNVWVTFLLIFFFQTLNLISPNRVGLVSMERSKI